MEDLQSLNQPDLSKFKNLPYTEDSIDALHRLTQDAFKTEQILDLGIQFLNTTTRLFELVSLYNAVTVLAKDNNLGFDEAIFLISASFDTGDLSITKREEVITMTPPVKLNHYIKEETRPGHKRPPLDTLTVIPCIPCPQPSFSSNNLTPLSECKYCESMVETKGGEVTCSFNSKNYWVKEEESNAKEGTD